MNKLKIAFIAHTNNPALIMNDPSFIYRCENLALSLRDLGHQVDLRHYTQIDTKVQYDIMVFHRPKYRLGFRHWLKKLRKRGTLAVADFDDLVFDAQWAEVSPGVINQQVSLSQTRKNFRAHQKALQAFDWATASTQPIIERLQAMGVGHTMLLPNAVHKSWLATPVPEKPERPRLTYFPGTRSHDQDFAIAQSAIERYLHDHPNVQLQITGPLSQTINCRDDQLLRFEKQPFSEYQHHIAQSWLNLAPLQNTLFNSHKSALKAIEGSFFNVATLASPIPDMQRLTHCGAILVPHASVPHVNVPNVNVPHARAPRASSSAHDHKASTPSLDAASTEAHELWYQAIAANLPTSAQACANSGLREKLQEANHIDAFCQQWLEWLELPTHGRA